MPEPGATRALLVTPAVLWAGLVAACGTKLAAVCGATVAVPLIQPGTQYEARRNQLDVRLSKTLQLTKKLRSSWNFDVYNLTNANPIQNTSWSSGSSFLRPLAIVPPRVLRIGGKVDW